MRVVCGQCRLKAVCCNAGIQDIPARSQIAGFKRAVSRQINAGRIVVALGSYLLKVSYRVGVLCSRAK
jgi:hypothetical protein